MQAHSFLKQFDGDDVRHSIYDNNWLLNTFVASRLKWWKHPDRRKEDRSRGGGAKKTREGVKRLQREKSGGTHVHFA
jgi:hypothetical protein